MEREKMEKPVGKRMNYVYTIAYKIEGITAQSLDRDKVVYQDDANGTIVILTSDIDLHCESIDRESACASLLIHGLFGGIKLEDVQIDAEAGITAIQEDRASKNKNGTYAIIIFEGEENVTIDENRLKETEQFSLCYDAIDKNVLRKKHEGTIHAIVASLAITINPEYRAVKIASGMCFRGENNKPLYSYSLKMGGNARLTHSKPTNADLEEEIGHIIGLASSNPDLKTPFRLFTQSLETTQDKLRAFSSAWSSIEILTNKIFIIYEKKFIDGIAGEHNSYGVNNFLDRIKDVMKDKYRLTDKFSLIASFLGSEIEEDIALFKSMKKIRDTISHGLEFDEETLPVEAARKLAGNYLKYHMLSNSQSANSAHIGK